MRRYYEHFLELCKNRIFVMLCGVIVLFAIIVLRLFSLQIIHGEEYEASITASVSKNLPVPASRGGIYDRYGRPLAINTVAYSVQVDGSLTLELSDNEKQNLSKALMNWLWENGHQQVNSLPISLSSPYTFTYEGTEEEMEKQENRWKASIGLEKKQYKMTAEECLTYLYEKYNVPSNYSPQQKRAYLSLVMCDDRNLMALTLALKLNEFGETITDELPLDTETPYAFQFGGNANREKSWKESMQMEKEQLKYNSLQTLDYLRDFFGLPEGLPNDLVRDTLGIRYSLYLKRYQQFQSVTIATDVSDKTLAYIEENQDTFPNVVIDTVSLREYPEGKYFAHIIGYIRQMTESDYALYKDEVDAQGNPLYSQTDIVGQDGMEKLYERELNGVDGNVQIEVDNQGRRMSVIDSTEPVSGKDVFLTLDSELQKVTYDTLESELRKAVLHKLTGGGKNSVSTTELFISMINVNHISAQKMLQAADGTQKAVYNKLKQANPTFRPDQDDAVTVAKEFLIDGLENGTISIKELTLMMIEQGHLPVTEEEKAGIENGASPLSLIIKKLSSGEISPADTGLDPCTGSVFVTQVGSGEVLASVTYPSYDNNELVNTFNNAYYNDLLQDGNTPLVNRPLKQKKAPGSTFKMIIALAGLESGTITPNTLITDKGLFKDAGLPYARCWIYSNTGGTHGPVNVSHALEVSCNYFFYELAYRMGNVDNGNSNQAITTLNEYMAAFGMNDYTGLELDEYGPTMASPDNKEKAVKTFNPDATTSQTRWTDGDTIRTAIGQSINSYTPAQMTKYVSTLANGGTLYRLHMVDHIQNPNGSLHSEVEEKVENVTKFKEENLQAVYDGMYLVTNGTRGTLRTAFNDLPIKVAAKTGTAEEDKNRSSHTWFVCFAPYDDPQIAITVMIPFGEGSGTPAPEVAKAIIREYLGLDYTPTNTTMQTVLAE
ncbi:MAG: hypothetical protein MR278_07900 [Bacteroidales bacterium]|nr:penicillin-binding transpeptidase domain-containing protein [Anaerotignum sp.]MCI5679881.1 hypothetical protein [Bacteroidales bacterium]MDY3926594.1 penicillin-binding transpeptidase domain-containing protein [Anaerotignum sp.]